MKVVFRVDASYHIGTGHVIRCLNLARELRERRCECAFICRPLEGNLVSRITDEGFEAVCLPGYQFEEEAGSRTEMYGDLWLGAPWEIDLQQTIDLIEDVPDWIVVDHYGIDHQWEAGISGSACKLMIIDDLANRKHKADILVDQNWYGENTEKRYSGLTSDKCETLLGPSFAMLDHAFRKARSNAIPRRGSVNNILIFFGGSDNCNLTTRAIHALNEGLLKKLHVTAVLGSNHSAFDDVNSLGLKRGNVSVVRGLPDLSQVMMSSDLMIGAGGITNWERCCLGLPSIIVSTAENQIEVNEALAFSNLINYLGRAEELATDDIVSMVNHSIDNPDRLIEQSKSMMQMVNGEGASRIAEQMMVC